MAQHNEIDESNCLCRKFVPADKRIDYDQQVRDPKTGKLVWKTLVRAHQDCPEHGLVIVDLAKQKDAA
ncbi:hypothetical protein vBCbaSRXM_94 [Citromicrobium phage vB_CbaS-RXM]|nr:hypothetical protein vBCbaSRXM_94 [Citromicrobium phage vB_CbaS-RXM]